MDWEQVYTIGGPTFKYTKQLNYEWMHTPPPPIQVWETGVMSPLESPRAITDDLPSFSLSPLPYITEVSVYQTSQPVLQHI